MKQFQVENNQGEAPDGPMEVPEGWALIEAAWSMFTFAFDDAKEVMSMYGLSRKALILLAVLDRADTPQLLAAYLQMPAPTVSHLLRGLEEMELIARSISTRDRRRFHLVRTPKGEEALRVGKASINDLLGQKMARFSNDERALLARALPLLHALSTQSEEENTP